MGHLVRNVPAAFAAVTVLSLCFSAIGATALPVTAAAEVTPGDTAAEAAPGDTAAEVTPGDTAAEAVSGDTGAEAAPGDMAAEATPHDTAAKAKPNDTKVCLGCHNRHPVNQILNSPHAQLSDPDTPFSQGGCEVCHGDATEHLKNPAHHPPFEFDADSPTPVSARNERCLTCHESGMASHWPGSTHENAGLACTNCHQIHAARQLVKDRETQPSVCFTCHKIIRAAFRRFSHHPVTEGQLTCTDCHAPHGSFGKKLLKKTTVNETCYTCHAEKRGPFLWEHPPVRDNCANCHLPHGSNQEFLLAMRGPLLCQQCHSADFHPGTLYSGDDVQPLGADRHVIAQNCLNCHSKVHGSNHPSGVRFTR